jgi:hypothetical protein
LELDWVALLLLIVLAATLLWMHAQSPYPVDPLLVASALREESLDRSLLTMSALLLPIVVLFLFGVVTLFLFFGWVIIAREKRYLDIIDELRRNH